MSDVEIEEVESVVNGLDLLDLDEPDFDVLRGGEKNSMAMLLSLAQNVGQVFYPSHDADGDLAAFGGRLGTGVQSGAETWVWRDYIQLGMNAKLYS